MGGTATWNPDPSTLKPIAPASTAWNPDPSTLVPINANTVMIGGKPVDLTTGAGASTAAESQNTAAANEQLRQAHGALGVTANGLPSRPESSQAQDEAVDAALGLQSHPLRPSFSGPTPSVPKGMENTANIAEKVPALAGAISGGPGTEALTAGLGALIDMVPNAKRAGDAFNAVKAVVGDHPVAVSDELSQSLMRYRELADAGGARSMSVEKLLQRLTNPDKGALTFNEARDFYSNISRLSRDEASRLTPVMKRAVGQIANDFGETIAETALRGDKLAEFQGAMQEYGRAMKLKDIGEDFAAHGIKYAGITAGSALGGGIGGYAVKHLIDSQAPK